MEYIVNLSRRLTSTEKKLFEEKQIELIYESKFLNVAGVNATSQEVFNDMDFIESVSTPILGEYQDAEYLSTLSFEPHIRKSLLTNQALVGWGDTRIAILDSGINSDVSVADQIDFTNTGITDRTNHGNDVAKIVKFFAKGASLFFAKVGEPKPNELYVMQGIEWAFDQGASIINISAGFKRKCKGNCNLCKLVDAVSEEGVAIVIAAGNRYNKVDSIDCPGHAVKGVTVGAVSRDYKLADYTSFGKPGEGKPNIVAPGDVHIDGRFRTGTSFAAPVVTGVIGAILNTVGSVSKAIEYIYKNVDDLGYPAHEQGLGCLNLQNLVEAIINEEGNSESTGQKESS